MQASELPDFETVLYGRKDGDEEWAETLLSTNLAAFEEVKRLAARDGWKHFRVARIDLRVPPDFTKAIKAI
jgi:hypothetical protein